MKKLKTFLIFAVVLALAALFCGCEGNFALTMGTGNEGGRYYKYGTNLSRRLSEDKSDISINVKTTAGSAANLRLMQQGFLDIAIVQSDTLLEAYSGKGAFSEMPCKGVRALAALYIEECQIIVKNNSDINSVSDLYGKRVSVGETESGVMKNAEQILFVNGISFDMIKAFNMSFSESAKALQNGEIDAFFITAGAPTAAVSELAENTEIRLISLDENTIERLRKEYGCYTECVIPAGTYKGQTEEARTVGVKAVLTASAKMPNETAERLIKDVFKYSDDINGRQLGADFAANDVPVPFHSGVSKWYSGLGINVSTSDSGDVGSVLPAGQD